MRYKIRPSGADQWMNCPASPRISATVKPLPSDFALEGNCAHMVGQLSLKEGKDPAEYVGKVHYQTPVTDEMADFVTGYVRRVLIDQQAYKGKLSIEETLDLSWMIPGASGTADTIIRRYLDALVIRDLKFGRGVYVAAKGNKQQMIYALGALGPKKGQELFTHVIITIDQPRKSVNGKIVRRWPVSVEFLRYWEEFILQPAIKKTQLETSPCIPGEHCGFCNGKVACPVMKNEIENLTGPLRLPVQHIPQPKAMTPLEIGRALEVGGLLKSWLKDLEGHAKMLDAQGTRIPGWKRVLKSGHRKWVDTVDISLPQIINHLQGPRPDPYNLKLKSPAQLETALKKLGYSWPNIKAMLSQLIVQPVSESFVKDSSPEPAVTSVQKLFKEVSK